MSTIKCANCNQDNPPEARFCGACGFALPSAPSEAAIAPPVLAPAVRVAVPAEYIGFWVRLAAFFIDALILSVARASLQLLLGLIPLYSVFGLPSGYFLSVSPYYLAFLISLAYFVLFTGLRGQTLGKMALKIKVVDSQGKAPGIGRAFLREAVGKFVSSIFLCLGFLWLAWDRRKQGWHDKIAETFVLRQGEVTTQTKILTHVLLGIIGAIILAGVGLVILAITLLTRL